MSQVKSKTTFNTFVQSFFFHGDVFLENLYFPVWVFHETRQKSFLLSLALRGDDRLVTQAKNFQKRFMKKSWTAGCE
jgi:hypothetical protein